MLLDEHSMMFEEGECTTMIPYWLRYVKDDDEIIYGCSREYVEERFSHVFDYDHTEVILKFLRFQADPIAYRKRKIKSK